LARWWALAGVVGLGLSMAAMTGPPAAASPHQGPAPHRVALRGSLTAARERAHPAGAVAGTSQVSFDLAFSLRNATAAQAFVRRGRGGGGVPPLRDRRAGGIAVRADPGGGGQGRGVAPPRRLQGRLCGQGPPVRARNGDGAAGRARVRREARLLQGERAQGPARQGHYDDSLVTRGGRLPHRGRQPVREHPPPRARGPPPRPPRPPGPPPAAQAAGAAREPPPPPGFRNPQPCSAFWGQKIDTKDSGKLYQPYTHPLPYDICGYKPAQMRGAYGLAGSVAKGNDGKGFTIA